MQDEKKFECMHKHASYNARALRRLEIKGYRPLSENTVRSFFIFFVTRKQCFSMIMKSKRKLLNGN
jgi:hypothetical protein